MSKVLRPLLSAWDLINQIWHCWFLFGLVIKASKLDTDSSPVELKKRVKEGKIGEEVKF